MPSRALEAMAAGKKRILPTFTTGTGKTFIALTPFRVKQISTTLDEYVYTLDGQVIEGQIEIGTCYTEQDFNCIIEIREREAHRAKLFMAQIDQRQKTLVFCATQDHVLAVRDLINQTKTSAVPNYCQRVTANDGELAGQFLRDFQDNEKLFRRLSRPRKNFRPVWMCATYAGCGVRPTRARNYSMDCPKKDLAKNNLLTDAIVDLGQPAEIGQVFAGFHQYLH